MRKLPETTQPAGYHFDKPAKQRIIEASDQLFRRYGIRAARAAIAHEAHSNMETLTKYFGGGEDLVRRFVTSLIEDAENRWRGLEVDHAGAPLTQLRLWLAMEQDRSGHIVSSQTLLARTAVELQRYPRDDDGLLSEIEHHWQAERRRVVRLCREAGVRDALELGDKLLLLVQGARNERDAYGRKGPSRLLRQAGEDLLAAHGASKPTVEPYTEQDLDSDG